ncbi:MAG: hypothetical protein PHS29_01840 [Candidatus Pacebacteria bacterium]|nr:hypothetical protein [Candidatus Paceibacterota bacterium]MDD3072204.1 hypothetical protein [Candidatus Paceibacterota bacterium]MDD4201161.1 hypothetical protein [Candidatus Paceibacterota bacterium]MDD4467453.1 hypothetical protein [Candidatus Paceibacterota bacterium]MDD4897748.1 hypothetical protein [Candidatus Paceibacterota bacterium]
MKNNFVRNLIKGKIAETIFAQMLRETNEFTVLEFGYEKVIPELIQQGYREDNVMVDTLRTAPDFAVINRKTREVKLIEVKYMRILNFSNILKYAKRMSQSWNPSYLFIASFDGFYFDEINEIIKNKGKIKPLKHPQIKEELKNRYLKTLRDFEIK